MERETDGQDYQGLSGVTHTNPVKSDEETDGASSLSLLALAGELAFLPFRMIKSALTS